MAGSDSSDLYDLADGILAAASTALDDAGLVAPANAFVAVGDPPFDCAPLLSVSFAMVDTMPLQPSGIGAGMHRLQGGHLNLVNFRVVCLRCAPTISSPPGGVWLSPTPAQMSALAESCYDDGWVLWNAFSALARSGSSPLAPFPCREFVLGPLMPVTPQGGVAGVLLTLQVSLDGYTS